MLKVLWRQAAEGDLGKAEAMGSEGSKMALGVIVNWSFPRTAGKGCHLGRGRTELGQRQWGGGRSPSGLQGQKSAEEPRGREKTPGQDGWNSTERGPRGATATGRERQQTWGPFPHLLQVLRPDTSPPVTEPRIPKRSVSGCGARSWGSGSQKEACSRPLEPQEGEQTPGEGGSEGVDEFL